MGRLILEWASRLDAFSGYPFRAWLPSAALGRTTGTPVARPTRSSRTRVSSPQPSYAHGRGTFYPLSDGPSTQNHRITKTDFRLCSSCLSRSQAGLCLYTLLAISNRHEPTFVSLRYSLGGDRPSQTTHQALSPRRITPAG